MSHQSAIYQGRVQHRRHQPRSHAFDYAMAMLYLDLDEVDQVFAKRWFWSVEKLNLASFRRRDYLGDAAISLIDAVRACVHTHTGKHATGPIRLLTHLRYFGYCFNPVSFYYCFDAEGSRLQFIVAEITNTPWRERHPYVLEVDHAKAHGDWLEWEFDKAFHVSPFLPMGLHYDWRFTQPMQRLNVHMNVSNPAAQKQFDATLQLQRRELTGFNLSRVLWQFPLMTVKVMLAIHWQALLLWLKQITVYDHPASAVRDPSHSNQDDVSTSNEKSHERH